MVGGLMDDWVTAQDGRAHSHVPGRLLQRENVLSDRISGRSMVPGCGTRAFLRIPDWALVLATYHASLLADGRGVSLLRDRL
jgi:hypothetical protein